MPKMKTKSSAKGRFRLTAKGKVRRNYAGKRPLALLLVFILGISISFETTEIQACSGGRACPLKRRRALFQAAVVIATG